MAIDANSAAELIMSSYRNAAGGAGAAAAAAPAPRDFCALWPVAKPILQVLAGIATIIPIPIPGGGVAAGGVLAGLINIGDKIYEEKCR